MLRASSDSSICWLLMHGLVIAVVVLLRSRTLLAPSVLANQELHKVTVLVADSAQACVDELK